MIRIEICQRVFLARVVATIAFLWISAFVAGCAANLKPAPQARTVRNNEPAAFSEVAGIRVAVVPNQWSGSPADLGDLVTIFRVEIENGSDEPLRIRYREFKLVAPGSFTNAAIPPYQVEGTVVKPVFLPQTYVYPRGFQFAPHYRTGVEDTSRPRHPWDYDDYTPRYNLWAAPLPTEYMLAKGIPEGVLEPEGALIRISLFREAPGESRPDYFRGRPCERPDRRYIRNGAHSVRDRVITMHYHGLINLLTSRSGSTVSRSNTDSPQLRQTAG